MLNQPVKQDRIFFPNLDGFRTIAFLIVFIGHAYILFDFQERTFLIKAINHFFGKPTIGVNFFFVLSGFLISYLLLTEKERYGKIQVGAFYMRRVLRIWPVYYLVVLISVLMAGFNKPFLSLHDANFSMILTFLTNFNLAGIGISSLPLTVLWSVAVEEQFYFILPLLIVFFGKRSFYIFPMLILLTFVAKWTHQDDLYYREFNTIGVGSSLLVGCLVAYGVLYHGLDRWIRQVSRGVIISAYAAFLIFHLYAPTSPAFTYFFYSLLFAFFILEQNYSENSFFKMKNSRLLSRTGKYTYGLYAYHMIVIAFLKVFIPGYFDPAHNYLVYFSLWAGALLLTFGMAYASYHVMEKPILTLKERFARLSSGAGVDKPEKPLTPSAQPLQ